jgi:WD40 repeat protein
VFHPLSYNNCINNENNPNLDNLSHIQLKEFGQTPEQLFFKPHPKKFSNKIVEIPLNNKQKEKNGNKSNNEDINDVNEKIIIEEKNENKIETNINNEKENKKNLEVKDSKRINYKPFPLIPDIDLKLKKKYKSIKKFDNCKLISGTIFQETNLIISGGINGHLNIYDYYSGEIIKSYSLSNPIENINSINKNNLIVYSSDYSINTFNISLGKNISSFYAHDTKILKLFYDEKYKNLISCTRSGIVHTWDINQNSEIPSFSHFLFDQSKIINVDYNENTQFFYSLDEEGKFSILNIYNEEEIYIWEEENKTNKAISISPNLKNLNEFIIGYEKGFKIFDVRNFKCVEDWTNDINFKVNKCFIDRDSILVESELQICLLDYKEKKTIGERKSKDKIEFFNFYKYDKNETRIIYGDEIGNVFYSEI